MKVRQYQENLKKEMESTYSETTALVQSVRKDNTKSKSASKAGKQKKRKKEN